MQTSTSLQTSAKIHLEHGETYGAKISLGAFAFVTNSVVESKLRTGGFKDVVVSGSGPVRDARGVWDGPTQAVDKKKFPQVSEIKKI